MLDDAVPLKAAPGPLADKLEYAVSSQTPGDWPDTGGLMKSKQPLPTQDVCDLQTADRPPEGAQGGGGGGGDAMIAGLSM